VFIAGGIGVTPCRSILGDLAASRTRASVVLLYSNGTSDIPFRSFLDGLLPNWPELRLIYTVTGLGVPHNRVTFEAFPGYGQR